MKQKQTYLKIKTKEGKTFEYTVLTEQGRIEKEVDELMKIIKSHAYRKSYDSVAVNTWRQENNIGEYRKWEFDAKRIEEIQQQVRDGEAHMHPKLTDNYEKIGRKGRLPGDTGGSYETKKQLRQEQEQLIHELNNG